jgi:hypothetical protein
LNLFHKFLLALFLSTLLGIVTLASTISYFVTKNVINEEATDTASLMGVLTLTGLGPDKFQQAVKARDMAIFKEMASQLMSMPEIVRVKIFDKTGTLVWSDEERLIGKNFEGNRELRDALGGEVRVAIGLLKNEHVYERDRYGGDPICVEIRSFGIHG